MALLLDAGQRWIEHPLGFIYSTLYREVRAQSGDVGDLMALHAS
jgi:hypothetical protein